MTDLPVKSAQRELKICGVNFNRFDVGRTTALINKEYEANIELETLLRLTQHSGTERSDETSELVTSGRGSSYRRVVNGISLIVRAYRRGGLIGKFQKYYFFSSKSRELLLTRPGMELFILSYLRSQNVSVPTPVGIVLRHSIFPLFYYAWIVTEEVQHSVDLASFKGDKERDVRAELSEFSRCAGALALAMLQAGVFHRDLHPGNVLVDERKELTLIDFDGASFLNGAAEIPIAVKRLVSRWSRFCRKYRLSEETSTGFLHGIEGR